MSRAPRRVSPDWTWDDDRWTAHPERADENGMLEVDSDDDRDIVGHILDRRGAPLHTVKRPGSVSFGYRSARA